MIEIYFRIGLFLFALTLQTVLSGISHNKLFFFTRSTWLNTRIWMAKWKKVLISFWMNSTHSNEIWETRKSGFVVWIHSFVVFTQNTIMNISFTEIHEKLLKSYRQPIQILCSNNVWEEYKYMRPILEWNKRKHSFLVIHDLVVIRVHTHTHMCCKKNRSLALYTTEHIDPSTNLSNTSKSFPTSLLWWRYAYLCLQTVLLTHLQCEGWIFTKKQQINR